MAKILLITSSPPYPPSRGGNQRTELLRRALEQFGPVDVFLALTPHTRIADEDLEVMRHKFRLIGWANAWPAGRFGGWRFVRPFHPALVDRLAHNFGNKAIAYAANQGVAPALRSVGPPDDYDLVVSRYLQPGAWAGCLEHPRLIVDIDDLDTQRYASRLQVPNQAWWKRRIIQWHLQTLQKLLPQHLARARHVFVTNNEDHRAVEQQSVSLLPNIPFVETGASPEPLPPDRDSQVVLTVSSMRFRVNEDAIEHFVKHVWPQIHAAQPQARFKIIGSGMTDAQKQKWSAVPGIEALGFVDDLLPHYQQCALTVTPVYEGGGTKIKVLESLLYGRTPVVTRHALRGYDHILLDGESVAVADTDADLAQRCVELLRSPDHREAMAACGAAQVRAHFTYARFADIVRQAVEPVLRDCSRIREGAE